MPPPPSLAARPPQPAARPVARKRKMSKAERKRLRAGNKGGGNWAGGSNPLGADNSAATASSTGTFRDEAHYISMVPNDQATERGYAVTQPGLEDAMLDLNPDSHEELYHKKKLVSHWDRKKKKYIKVGLDEIDGVTGRRKKTDHGASNAKNKGKQKKTLQQQYDKWSEKNKRQITRAGAPIEAGKGGGNGGGGAEIEVRADWRNGYRAAHRKTSHGIKHAYQESAKSMRQKARAEARRSKGGAPGAGRAKGPREEIRSEADIRKAQKAKERRIQQVRGIRPHKKLAPNQPRPSKAKLQFKNMYGTKSGTGGKGRKRKRGF